MCHWISICFSFAILFNIFLSLFPCCASPLSLHELTLEEKVGQLLMTQFHGTTVNADAEILVNQLHIGGIIYYNWSNSLESPKQVLELSSGLQNLAAQNRLHIPLLIAVDQEGGLVARFTNGFTVFPGNKALGMTGSPDLAEKCALAMGQELRAVGVNMNLAPVVDVNTHPHNPVIGIRSFGDSTNIVIPFAKSALQGYHSAGVITTLKHFPGHGDVHIDSHEDLPILHKSKQQLQNIELLPFAALANQADTIMTAHIMLPAIDPKYCATLSKNVLDILRDEIGFNGVVITDSLVMEGVLKNCSSVDDAAICAFNAGCDILLLGGKQLINGQKTELTVKDITRIHQSLIDAVKQGRISENKLNQSVERILQLKQKYCKQISDFSTSSVLIDTVAHHELARDVAILAVRVIKNAAFPLTPLEHCAFVVIAPDNVQAQIYKTNILLSEKASRNKPFFYRGLSPTHEEICTAVEMTQNADSIFVCSYNAWKNPSQVRLVHALCETKKPVFVIALRDPLDAPLFPEAAVVVTTFSPTAPAIQAAFDAIKR